MATNEKRLKQADHLFWHGSTREIGEAIAAAERRGAERERARHEADLARLRRIEEAAREVDRIDREGPSQPYEGMLARRRLRAALEVSDD